MGSSFSCTWHVRPHGEREFHKPAYLHSVDELKGAIRGAAMAGGVTTEVGLDEPP